MNTFGRVVLTIEATLLGLALTITAVWLIAQPSLVADAAGGTAVRGVITARHVEDAPGRKGAARMRTRLRVVWQPDTRALAAWWFAGTDSSQIPFEIVSEFTGDSFPEAFGPGAEVAVFETADGPGLVAALGPVAAVGTPAPPQSAGVQDDLAAWLVLCLGLIAMAWAGLRWRRHAAARRQARHIPWRSQWHGPPQSSDGATG